MAFPHSVVPNDGAFRQRALALVRDHEAEVVLGDSRAHDGSENRIATAIKNFADFLEGNGVVVHFEPERYTSREAERIQGRTDMTDASAAALILDGFLRRRDNQRII
jgi:RNase H-fold protein (predicted Holliday junction resolvase)